MCYCCRKLEILCILYVWEAEFGRPWEAVWGRGALIGLEICVRESQIFGANQSPTASHGLSRPLTASHNLSCDLSEPIRGARPLTHTASHGLSDLWGRGSPRCRSALSRTPGDAVILGGYLTDFTAKRIASPGRVRSASHAQRPRVRSSGYLTDFTAKCIAHTVESDRTPTASQIGLTDRPHRSDSQICEAVGGRAKSCDLSESPCTASHGLTDLRVRSVRPIGLSRTAGDAVWSSAKPMASPGVRERPIGLTDRTLKSVRPCSDSHGLSPHRSQIGLSDRSDYVTDLTDSFHSYLDRSDVP